MVVATYRAAQLRKELKETEAHAVGLRAELKHLEGPELATRPKRRRRRLAIESDDDEVIPPSKVFKAEKLPGPAASTSSPSRSSVPTAQRGEKRSFSVSELSESINALGDSNADAETASDASKPPDPPPARKKVPPLNPPLSKTPLPSPSRTQTPKAPASTFRTPTVSGRSNQDLNGWLNETYQDTPSKAGKTNPKTKPETKNNNNRKSKKPAPSNPNPNTQSQTQSSSQHPSYAEIIPFNFKLIVSYLNAAKTEYDYHTRSDLSSTMSAFWSRLGALVDDWENAAGGDWAWDVQRASSSSLGKRVCVARKLAKMPTKWRKGDSGFFACYHCAGEGKPCFTWVRADGEDYEDEDDEAFGGAPKGEFWCLPVHKDDRRADVRVGKEMWTWVNECRREDVGSDSSSDDDDGDVFWDDYVAESDGGAECQSEPESEPDSDEGDAKLAEEVGMDSDELEDT